MLHCSNSLMIMSCIMCACIVCSVLSSGHTHAHERVGRTSGSGEMKVGIVFYSELRFWLILYDNDRQLCVHYKHGTMYNIHSHNNQADEVVKQNKKTNR